MTKTTIKKRVKYWQERLGMKNWDIVIHFEEIKKTKKSSFSTVGRAKIDNEYKLASFFFPPSQLDGVNDEVIVHEFVHCLLGQYDGYILANTPLKQKGERWLEYINEQTTTEIERIIMRLWRKEL